VTRRAAAPPQTKDGTRMATTDERAASAQDVLRRVDEENVEFVRF
jgi:hypothetical protein